MAEHLTFNQGVLGSIPRRLTKFSTACATDPPGPSGFSIFAGETSHEEWTDHRDGRRERDARVDGSGRVWVATAAYSNTDSDRIYLVATAGATPIEVVAGLHTVLGLLWIGDSLLASSSAAVVAYSAFDGAHFGRS